MGDYDSPVLYALKTKDEKLLTFMMSAKVCDDITWEYYTTTLCQTNRHEDALLMAEEKGGIPIVVELISGHNLPAHDFDDENDPDNGTSDPYVSVSVGEKVKRTETIMKNLNPKWKQPLLFLLNAEDIPDSLAGGLGDIGMNALGNMGGMSRKRSKYDHDDNGIKRRRTSFHQRGHHHANHQGGLHGKVGSVLSRLEINFKIYDYDEVEDDFFMGSYKHKINWTKQALEEHQNGVNEPTIFDKPLHGSNNKQNVGSFKFKIYTGTLQHYIKWGRNKK